MIRLMLGIELYNLTFGEDTTNISFMRSLSTIKFVLSEKPAKQSLWLLKICQTFWNFHLYLLGVCDLSYFSQSHWLILPFRGWHFCSGSIGLHQCRSTNQRITLFWPNSTQRNLSITWCRQPQLLNSTIDQVFFLMRSVAETPDKWRRRISDRWLSMAMDGEFTWHWRRTSSGSSQQWLSSGYHRSLHH